MKIIAFMARGHPVDEGEAIRAILTHRGEPVDPPRIAPARGPPLWEATASRATMHCWRSRFRSSSSISGSRGKASFRCCPTGAFVSVTLKRKARSVFRVIDTNFRIDRTNLAENLAGNFG